MSRARDLADLGGSANAGTVTGESLIINGDCSVAQRGGSATAATASGSYSVDRFKAFASGGGAFTSEQSTTVPNDTFKNSTKLVVTTNDSSIASTDYYALNQHIEGRNIISTAYGTSDAKYLTLSFWVRSSVTGTYAVACYNSDGSRGYLNTYNIDTADTWTEVSLSWEGDTGGTWNKGGVVGIAIRFDLGTGSNGEGTANQWTTSGTYAASRTTTTEDWIANSGATFYLTGVKLEIGTTKTQFKHEKYADNLFKCQRYYYRIQAEANYQRFLGTQSPSTTNAQGTLTLPTEMRSEPTIDNTGTASHYAFYRNNAVSACTVAPVVSSAGSNNQSVNVSATTSSVLTVGESGDLVANNNTSVFLGFNAEL